MPQATYMCQCGTQERSLQHGHATNIHVLVAGGHYPTDMSCNTCVQGPGGGLLLHPCAINTCMCKGIGIISTQTPSTYMCQPGTQGVVGSLQYEPAINIHVPVQEVSLPHRHAKQHIFVAWRGGGHYNTDLPCNVHVLGPGDWGGGFIATPTCHQHVCVSAGGDHISIDIMLSTHVCHSKGVTAMWTG